MTALEENEHVIPMTDRTKDMVTTYFPVLMQPIGCEWFFGDVTAALKKSGVSETQ